MQMPSCLGIAQSVYWLVARRSPTKSRDKGKEPCRTATSSIGNNAAVIVAPRLCRYFEPVSEASISQADRQASIF